MAQRAWSRFWMALCLAFSCGACASYSYVRFLPAIQDAELREGAEVEAHVVVAWQGVYTRNDGYDLRFRVRVENARSVPFPLEPAEFELVDGALTPFGPVRVELPATVEAGRDVTFDIAFPVPGSKTPEQLDLSALNLRIRLQGGRLSWSTNYQRELRSSYYDPYYGPYYGPSWGPYWGPYWGFHGSVVWCHH